jgi:hypothetical protein
MAKLCHQLVVSRRDMWWVGKINANKTIRSVGTIENYADHKTSKEK